MCDCVWCVGVCRLLYCQTTECLTQAFINFLSVGLTILINIDGFDNVTELVHTEPHSNVFEVFPQFVNFYCSRLVLIVAGEYHVDLSTNIWVCHFLKFIILLTQIEFLNLEHEHLKLQIILLPSLLEGLVNRSTTAFLIFWPENHICKFLPVLKTQN